MSSDSERSTSPSKTVVTVISSNPMRGEGRREACLVVIYGDDIGRRVPLGSRDTLVGRSSKCDLQIEQESVSRNHCRLSFNGKNFTIRDLGSTNGTYVNDEVIDDVALHDGDQVKVGRTILKFIIGNNIEAQYHEEIYRLMTVDGLTEVSNKRFFEETLHRESSRCERYDRTFSMVMIDIDHFKRINDTYGHLAGDAILRQLGALLRDRVRKDDTVARLGGEEFGVILPEIQEKGAVEFAESVRKLVKKTRFQFEDVTIDVTISLGVAVWGPDVRSGEDLVKAADAKLYEAKRNGRNRVCH